MAGARFSGRVWARLRGMGRGIAGGKLRGMGRGSTGAWLRGMGRGSAGVKLRDMGRGYHAITALKVIKRNQIKMIKNS